MGKAGHYNYPLLLQHRLRESTQRNSSDSRGMLREKKEKRQRGKRTDPLGFPSLDPCRSQNQGPALSGSLSSPSQQAPPDFGCACSRHLSQRQTRFCLHLVLPSWTRKENVREKVDSTREPTAEVPLETEEG